ncbi:hypothetical protein Sj15T_01790 [Sphingobium sp. TA15]|nr:hypothetical protein [Sphingobium indicum]BDD65158.1 hypothetical protein Sj15T_01790 [Sphingobium sp. TA15]
MTIEYDEQRLNHFLSLLAKRKPHEAKGWVGAVPSAWAAKAIGGGLERWTEAMCRDCLRSALEVETSPLARAMLVLSWGGMRTRNAKLLLNDPSSPWLTLIDSMWNGDLDATAAYAEFSNLRRTSVGTPKGLPGMGPAYYTKLIFFLSRGKRTGYIMDQWTACSVNLLCGKDVVLTDVHKSWNRSGRLVEGYTVSDQNSADNYRAFNAVIEELVTRSDAADGEEIELALFDQGRGHGKWRNYVVQHRQAPYDGRLRKVIEDVDADGGEESKEHRQPSCRCRTGLSNPGWRAEKSRVLPSRSLNLKRWGTAS